MTESAPATPRSTGRSTGGRRAIALLAIAATLTVAVAGAILTSGTGWLNVMVDRVAGESGGFVGGLLPVGFAFGAGMASAFNPCGFALLPTYLGLFLAEGEDPGAHARVATRLARAPRRPRSRAPTRAPSRSGRRAVDRTTGQPVAGGEDQRDAETERDPGQPVDEDTRADAHRHTNHAEQARSRP